MELLDKFQNFHRINRWISIYFIVDFQNYSGLLTHIHKECEDLHAQSSSFIGIEGKLFKEDNNSTRSS